MSRYYFHVRDGDKLRTDPEGADFRSLDAARDEAIHAAREIMAEKVLKGEVISNECFEVTNGSGTIVLQIPFNSVLRLE